MKKMAKVFKLRSFNLAL